MWYQNKQMWYRMRKLSATTANAITKNTNQHTTRPLTSHNILTTPIYPHLTLQFRARRAKGLAECTSPPTTRPLTPHSFLTTPIYQHHTIAIFSAIQCKEGPQP